MSSVAAAVVASAVIGGVASKYSADVQEDASRSAVDAQQQGLAGQMSLEERRLLFEKEEAEKAREFQAQQMGIQEQYRNELKQAGQKGITNIMSAERSAKRAHKKARNIFQELADPSYLERAQSIMQDPSQIMQDPGVAFEQRQGEKQLEKLLSKTTGGGLSGGSIQAAQEYGQGFASTQIDKALSRLMPFINVDIGARENIARLATVAGDRALNIANQKSQTRFVGAGGAPPIYNYLRSNEGQSLSRMGGLQSQMGQVQAQGAISQANIQSNLLQNLIGIGGQVGQAYLMGSGRRWHGWS